jgi:5,10-methylene-tetrahydrofolate dehydrogenase/methenyl tetrahydrofolate cyclohydrolase
MARILDGVAIASAIKQEVAEEVTRLVGQGVRPGLDAELVGNVAASELFSAYTPVPGGVGLLTIAMLMANTVRAARMRRESLRRGL